MRANLLSKTLSSVLILVFSLSAFALKPKAKPAPAKEKETAAASEYKGGQTVVGIPGAPKSQSELADECMEKPYSKQLYPNDLAKRQEYCDERTARLNNGTSKEESKCEAIEKEINDLREKCKGPCQENTSKCFQITSPRKSEANLTKSALDAWAAARGIPLNLSGEQASVSSKGTVNCKLSPERCEKKKGDIETEVKKLEEDLTKAQRASNEADSKHKTHLKEISDQSNREKEAFDKKKISENEKMGHKATDAERNRSEAKDRIRRLENSRDSIKTQIGQADKAVKLQLVDLSLSSIKGACTKEADSSTTVKSSVKGGISNAIGSSKVQAWQDAYSRCKEKKETQRQAVTQDYYDTLERLNAAFKTTQEQIAEQQQGLVLQTQQLEAAYQAMKDQLSVEEQAHMQAQINFQKEYNEAEADNTTRRAIDAKEIQSLIARIAQKNNELARQGECPVKSNPDTSLDQDRRTYSTLIRLTEKYKADRACCSKDDSKKSQKGTLCSYSPKQDELPGAGSDSESENADK